jgi:hypothetical protein
MNILLERCSLLHLFLFRRTFKKSHKVYFLVTMVGRIDYLEQMEILIFKKVFHFLFINKTLEELPRSFLGNYEWESNYESAYVAKNNEKNFKKYYAIKVLSKFVSSDFVIRYFQGSFTKFYSRTILFKKLKQSNKFLYSWELISAQGNGGWLTRTFESLDILAKSVIYILISLFIPSLFLLKLSLRGFSFKRNLKRKKYLIKMPILWGFSNYKSNSETGVKSFKSDDYLYGSQILPGDILHLFDKWKMTNKRKQEVCNIMDKEGYSYRDSATFKLNINIIIYGFKSQLLMIYVTLINLQHMRINFEQLILLSQLPKGLYYYLRKVFELESISYEIDFIKDDYNPGHVIEVIAAKQYGVKCVGVQHAGSLYEAPQLGFVYMDRYIVYGEIYERFFKDFWDKSILAKLGRESIDSIQNIAIIENNTNQLKKSVIGKYGKFDYCVTVLLPGISKMCIDDRWEEMIAALEEIATNDNNIKIFLRVRNYYDAKGHKYLKKIIDLADGEKIIVSTIDYSTHELMVISDLVITPAASFGINEAVSIGVKVFTFDYVGTGGLYFEKRYGVNFVMKTKEDLIRVIKGVSKDFDGLSYNYKKLHKELNYYNDVNVSQRYQELLLSM